MSKHIIEMELTPSSIRKAEAELRRMKRELYGIGSKLDEVCRRLAEIGCRAIETAHLSTWLMYTADTGHNPSAFEVQPCEGGYKIVGSGTDILFIEFGAGITYGGGHPLADGNLTGVGTYNSGSKKAENPNGWWTPEGKHTYGNPPACGVVNATDEIRENIKQIVEEVFNG